MCLGLYGHRAVSQHCDASRTTGTRQQTRRILEMCPKKVSEADPAVCAQAVALLAFMTTTLSALASAVHFLVLQLFTHDAHLPPCAPDQRVCAETYNLLLVL